MAVPTVEPESGIGYLTSEGALGSFVAKLNSCQLGTIDSPLVILPTAREAKYYTYPCLASYCLFASVISVVLHQQRTL